MCGFCTRTDIVREHLEDNLRICDVSAKGLLSVECRGGGGDFSIHGLRYKKHKTAHAL